MTRGHVVLRYGKAYLSYLSLCSLAVALFKLFPSYAVFPLKDNESAGRSKSFYWSNGTKISMVCQQGPVVSVDQYQLAQK